MHIVLWFFYITEPMSGLLPRIQDVLIKCNKAVFFDLLTSITLL